MAELIEVPDLVGLVVRVARQVGHQSGFVVTGPDQDGPPLGALTWPGTWVVTEQIPVAGALLGRGERLIVLFEEVPGGGSAGDREPRRPSPSPHSAEAEAEIGTAPQNLPEPEPKAGGVERVESLGPEPGPG